MSGRMLGHDGRELCGQRRIGGERDRERMAGWQSQWWRDEVEENDRCRTETCCSWVEPHNTDVHAHTDTNCFKTQYSVCITHDVFIQYMCDASPQYMQTNI